MNKEKLKQLLNSLNINPNFYSLDGELLPDRIVLYQNYNIWEVFYYDEKGNRDSFKKFDSEADACDYIYKLFKNS